MNPWQPHWGSLPGTAGVGAHLALEWLGYALGSWLYWRRRNPLPRPADRLVQLGVLAGAALGAALGAHALYVLQYAGALGGQPPAAWLGGKTIVGGLLGGWLGVEAAKRLLGWRDSTGDRFVLPLAVALVSGRAGCQLAGAWDLTYGTPTTLPWAWDYGDGVPRHPVSLYEILAILPLAALVLRIRPGRAGLLPGDRFRLFLAGYLLLRLALDGLKPPHGPVAVVAGQPMLLPSAWAGLAPIQWACLAGLGYHALHLVRRMRAADG